MPQPFRPDVLSELDHVLAAADADSSPWRTPDGSGDPDAREYVLLVGPWLLVHRV